MAQNGKKLQELLIQKLDHIEQELREVRQRDIPSLKIDMAVVKEKSNNSAKIISGIGGAIAIAVSTAVAFLK